MNNVGINLKPKISKKQWFLFLITQVINFIIGMVDKMVHQYKLNNGQLQSKGVELEDQSCCACLCLPATKLELA